MYYHIPVPVDRPLMMTHNLDLSAPIDFENPLHHTVRSLLSGRLKMSELSPLVTILPHEATEFTEPHVSQQGLIHRTPATVARQPRVGLNQDQRQLRPRQPLAKQRAPVYDISYSPTSTFRVSSYSRPTGLHLLRTSQPKHSFNQNAVPIYRYSPHLHHSTVLPHHN